MTETHIVPSTISQPSSWTSLALMPIHTTWRWLQSSDNTPIVLPSVECSVLTTDVSLWRRRRRHKSVVVIVRIIGYCLGAKEAKGEIREGNATKDQDEGEDLKHIFSNNRNAHESDGQDLPWPCKISVQ